MLVEVPTSNNAESPKGGVERACLESPSGLLGLVI